MFNKTKAGSSTTNSNNNTQSIKTGSKKEPSKVVSTIIGGSTLVHGKMEFSGGLLIEGRVIGDIASVGDDAILILEETGHIEGEVNVQNIIVNGTVKGDIRVADQAELSANAVVHGDVYYDKLEMLNGARINGSLVHQSAAVKPAATKRETTDASPVKQTMDATAIKNG